MKKKEAVKESNNYDEYFEGRMIGPYEAKKQVPNPIGSFYVECICEMCGQKHTMPYHPLLLSFFNAFKEFCVCDLNKKRWTLLKKVHGFRHEEATL